MVPFSMFTSQFGSNFSPRALCILGIIISAIGCTLIGLGITAAYGIGIIFYIGLFILGVGSGLVASQANFIVSISIKDKKLAAGSSGLQGAMRNIGQALSISIVGVIFIVVLTVAFQTNVNNSKYFDSITKHKVSKVDVIYPDSDKTIMKIIHSRYPHISPEGKKAAISLMRDSSIFAFKLTNIIMGIILLLFIFLAKDISSEKLKDIKKEKN
jgi:hypothetical protein